MTFLARKVNPDYQKEIKVICPLSSATSLTSECRW